MMEDLLYTPHDQRLSATTITCREYAFDIRRVLLERCLDIGSSILLDAEGLDNLGLRSQETKGKEDQLGGEELLGTWHLLHLPAATAVLGPLNAH